MSKKWYNESTKEGFITHFVKTVIKKEIKAGFILKTDMKIKILPDDFEIDLEKVKDKIITYISDDNFIVIDNDKSDIGEKRFNLLAYTVFGFKMYGDILILKKGKERNEK